MFFAVDGGLRVVMCVSFMLSVMRCVVCVVCCVLRAACCVLLLVVYGVFQDLRDELCCVLCVAHVFYAYVLCVASCCAQESTV